MEETVTQRLSPVEAALNALRIVMVKGGATVANAIVILGILVRVVGNTQLLVRICAVATVLATSVWKGYLPANARMDTAVETAPSGLTQSLAPTIAGAEESASRANAAVMMDSRKLIAHCGSQLVLTTVRGKVFAMSSPAYASAIGPSVASIAPSARCRASVHGIAWGVAFATRERLVINGHAIVKTVMEGLTAQ